MKRTLLFLTGFALAGVVVYNLNRPATPVEPISTTVDQEASVTAAAAPQSDTPLTGAAKHRGVTKKILVIKPNSDRVLRLYGEVNEMSLLVADQIKVLSAQSKEPIYLLINSPGGSVLDGAQIVSAIEGSVAPVYTVCEQLCASMAAIIHQYGKERLMYDRSILMFHNAAGGAQGYVPQMLSRLNVINRYVNKMQAHIAARAGVDLTTWLNRMGDEIWIDAEDATASNLNDKIVNVIPEAKAGSALIPSGPPANKAKAKIDLNWSGE